MPALSDEPARPSSRTALTTLGLGVEASCTFQTGVSAGGPTQVWDSPWRGDDTYQKFFSFKIFLLLSSGGRRIIPPAPATSSSLRASLAGQRACSCFQEEI